LNAYIHDSAIVDPGAEIGEGCKIWHWTHICAGAKIGRNTSFGQNVFVGNDVVVGNQCKIQNNVSLYDSVVLEDEVFCGPSVVFTNVINPRASVIRKSEYLTTIIRRGATIGANATSVCGIEIGAYAFVGAGAVITKSVPNFALMVGVPANQIGWMSKFGERLDLPLKGNGSAVCSSSGEMYHLRDGDIISQI
jgi:UDP-2-acetamido-3-amino-2,3-dideoxy-glucuronate N-acetyltransferase